MSSQNSFQKKTRFLSRRDYTTHTHTQHTTTHDARSTTKKTGTNKKYLEGSGFDVSFPVSIRFAQCGLSIMLIISSLRPFRSPGSTQERVKIPPLEPKRQSQISLSRIEVTNDEVLREISVKFSPLRVKRAATGYNPWWEGAIRVTTPGRIGRNVVHLNESGVDQRKHSFLSPVAKPRCMSASHYGHINESNELTLVSRRKPKISR